MPCPEYIKLNKPSKRNNGRKGKGGKQGGNNRGGNNNSNGKEKRKRAPGKEGKLGVEGMKPEVILEALRRAGATFLDKAAEPAAEKTPITKADLMEWGLAGGAGSSQRRQALLRRLELPEHLTANGMLEALNLLTDREELERVLTTEEL